MRRVDCTPRPHWERTVERQGVVYHHWRDGAELRQYWDESACYVLTPDEADQLRTATDELHGMCLTAVDHVVREGRLAEFGFAASDPAIEAIERSWFASEPTLYGRFDFVFDGTGPPKMLEYNADTPTCLLEAAVASAQWAADTAPSAGQFNAVHDHLVAAWAVLRARLAPGEQAPVLHVLHSGGDRYGEDYFTAVYLQDTARQAGWNALGVRIEDVRWDDASMRFTDGRGGPLSRVFKLYPWEWMLEEDLGEELLASLSTTAWIEPLWKLVLGNKAILPVLWELFPDHPNLLPAYADGPRELTSYASKPLLGREGSNVTLVRSGGTVVTSDGPYASSPMVFQQYAELPQLVPGRYVVVGSWVAGHVACGLTFRESTTPITDERQTFVPHLVQP